jgi:uncharacterized protein YceK
LRIYREGQYFIFKVVFILLCVSLSNCATIVSGTSQGVFIDTPKVENASCDLKDQEGAVYHLSKSPGNVTVQKGNGPLTIICGKQGYENGTTLVESDFSDIAFGNILMPGGSIGILIDAVTGAAQQYPDNIMVWMKPFKWTSQAEETDWYKQRDDYLQDLADKAKAAEVVADGDQDCC